MNAVQCGALFFFAGRIANPPGGDLLQSRIHKSGELAVIAPKLKRPPHFCMVDFHASLPYDQNRVDWITIYQLRGVGFAIRPRTNGTKL
jgi:hypothetical protein